jgi:hypothetical protein
VEEEEAREVAGRLVGGAGGRLGGGRRSPGGGPRSPGGRILPRKWGGRQIHSTAEKVGTRFCLHFVLFSSRDIDFLFHNCYFNTICTN